MPLAETKLQRNIGLDLLRATAMLLVICGHILGQGGVVAAEHVGTAGYAVSNFLNVFSSCAVDCFVIISGYVACKNSFKLSRIIKLWLAVVFWSVAVSCAYFVFVPETRTLGEAVSMFLPIIRGRYWFFTAYFVMFMFSPVLNHVISTISQRQFKLLLLTVFAVFGLVPILSLGYDVLRIQQGYEFSWLVVLYLVGGYLRTYGIRSEETTAPRVFFAMAIGIAVLHIAYKLIIEWLTGTVLGHSAYGNLFMGYTSPLIVGEAICLFLCFKNLKIKRDGGWAKLAKFMAPLVFSVYIIHVHPLVFWRSLEGAFAFLAEWNPILMAAVVIGIAVAVFTVCIVLDYIRLLIFKALHLPQLADRIGERITERVYRILRIEG